MGISTCILFCIAAVEKRLLMHTLPIYWVLAQQKLLSGNPSLSSKVDILYIHVCILYNMRYTIYDLHKYWKNRIHHSFSTEEEWKISLSNSHFIGLASDYLRKMHHHWLKRNHPLSTARIYKPRHQIVWLCHMSQII